MSLCAVVLRAVVPMATILALTSAVETSFITSSRRLSYGNMLKNLQALSPVESITNDDQSSEEPSYVDPQTISDRVFLADKRPIILFDGVCNLCNGAVNLALDWDPKGKLRFSALQSNVGRALLESNGRERHDISSIVLVTKDGAYIKSDAILRISQELAPPFLPGLRPLSAIGLFAIPKFLRDLIYDGVADNRYDLMGIRDECRFDADGEFEDRFVDDALALR